MNYNNPFTCSQCLNEFSRENFAVTLMCGHSYCKLCMERKASSSKEFTCNIDKIKSQIFISPSIDLLNLIDYAKTIPEIYSKVEIKSLPKSTNRISDSSHMNEFFSRPICRFYRQGYCRFGSRCWNIHA